MVSTMSAALRSSAKAALEFCSGQPATPDIIHCHDWQTGLVPVLLFEQYATPACTGSGLLGTIHNFKHQGLTGEYVLGNRSDQYCPLFQLRSAAR